MQGWPLAHCYLEGWDPRAQRHVHLTRAVPRRYGNSGDSAGNFFIDPVFNETVQIVEFDEGFDTETFFMYVCMCGLSVLLLFLVFNFFSGEYILKKNCLDFTFCSSGKKGGSRPKPVEKGTNENDVDFEWIPKSNLRTPGSGKTSPRQRKSKRNAGSDSD